MHPFPAQSKNERNGALRECGLLSLLPTLLYPQMKNLLLVTIGCVFGSWTSAAMALTVQDLEGRTLEVEVLDYDPSTHLIRIRRDDGRVFTLPVAKFDPSYQKALVEAAPVRIGELESRVTIGKRRRKHEDYPSYVNQELSMEVEVRNRTNDADFPEANFTFIVIGKDTRDNGEYEILVHETVRKAIPRLATERWDYEEFQNIYDTASTASNRGGEEYHGWILLAHDDEGTIHFFDTSDTIVRKRMESDKAYLTELLQLEAGHRGPRDLVESIES